MQRIRQKLFHLTLALAWLAAPLAHAGYHVLLAQQRPIASAFEALAERACHSPGVRLHAPHRLHQDRCENCQSMAQAKGLAPAVPVLADLQPVWGFAKCAAPSSPRSDAFLLFDHRGPPLQA